MKKLRLRIPLLAHFSISSQYPWAIQLAIIKIFLALIKRRTSSSIIFRIHQHMHHGESWHGWCMMAKTSLKFMIEQRAGTGHNPWKHHYQYSRIGAILLLETLQICRGFGYVSNRAHLIKGVPNVSRDIWKSSHPIQIKASWRTLQ